MSKRSIVEYFGLGDGHRCGYCGGSDGNVSHGMWAHQMTCKDYEDLINRGWRRSGKYVYKPLMETICCKPYTIRCDVENFKLSKSQKKVLKRMKKFLISDEGKRSCSSETGPDEGPVNCMSELVEPDPHQKPHLEKSPTKPNTSPSAPLNETGCQTATSSEREALTETRQKFQAAKQLKNERKDIEEMIESMPAKEALAHNLEVKCVRVDVTNEEFMKNLEDSFQLFSKYQKVVHKDPVEKLTMKRFRRFLVDCPLIAEDPAADLPSTGLGAFHQQYYLDGKLIAVGVVDILPTCISSKYFFYDPEFSFLSLGTYSALREIYFVRTLLRKCPNFKYYYMGYYIHSCQKMRYKGNYDPSFLLCPESYTFQPIKTCTQKLDAAPYARLDPTDTKDILPDINNVLVLHKGQAMPFMLYVQVFLRNEEERKVNMNEVQEYCKLAGKVANSMLLYRS